MSFPMKPNKDQIKKEKNRFENTNANYPEFSEVHNYPDPYRHVGQRINTNPNNKYEKYEKAKEKKKQYKQYPKNPKQIKPIKKVPVPVTKYVAVPVGPPMLMPVVTEKMVPVYPQNPVYPYPPPQYGPYNYNYPYPPPNYNGNNVLVIPPGYHRDYSNRYGLVGELVDDFMNLI